MTAAASTVEILANLKAHGLRLWADGGRIFASPKGAITDDLRALIRAHKAELLAVLSAPAKAPAKTPAAPEAAKLRPVHSVQQAPRQRYDPHSAEAMEARRKRVVALLEADSARRLAVVCDADGDPVPVAIAIRDKGTCEVHIPVARFDPFKLLDLVAKHGATVH